MATSAPLPRVLLVDDDALVRRWVEAALDGMPLQLETCADVAQARDALAAAPAALVICDLMMPGTPGLDWLAELAADDGLRRGARLVAFSAGVDATTRAQLQALGVWRVLHKPLPLADLLGCVQDGLALVPAAAAAGAAAPTAACATGGAEQVDTIQRHFGGDAVLYRDYRASCLVQFPQDVAAGDAAQLSQDLAALRRLGHSLKTVLRLLGLPGPAAQAQALDEAARLGDIAATAQAWQALRASLSDLSAAA